MDRHVHRKQKYVQDNHMPFINKNLSNEIMKRSKLRKQFLKDRTEQKKNMPHSKTTVCVSLLRKTEKDEKP